MITQPTTPTLFRSLHHPQTMYGLKGLAVAAFVAMALAGPIEPSSGTRQTNFHGVSESDSTPREIGGAGCDASRRSGRQGSPYAQQPQAAIVDANPTRTTMAGSEPRLELRKPAATPPANALAGGCTTTVSLVPGPDFTPCAIDGTRPWDGTQTVYVSTVTAAREVDCHGCVDVEVARPRRYGCPNREIDAVVTAAAPSTLWETVCAASSAATALPELAPRRWRAVAGGEHSPRADLDETARRRDVLACPFVYWVQAPVDAGPTATTYRQIQTQTSRVDCGQGCKQIIATTVLAGGGPARRITATVTLALGTTTVYACL